MAMLTDPDALPQLIGDYQPADHWQAHINNLFYGLRAGHLHEYAQTFASADYRLAHALAAHYYEKVKAREKTGGGRRKAGDGVIRNDTLVIHEWGPGNGNLAACFLTHLKSLDKDGLVYPRVKYVLVDGHQAILDGAAAHPDLASHLARVETLCADVKKLSRVQDASVDRILCNELWNDLPTKLMLRKDGEIEEEFMRPNLKEHRYAEIKDWSVFVHAFDAGDLDTLRGFDPFLDDIVWEKEYRKVEWKDVPFRKTMTEMLKLVDEQVLVPVNIGAAETIREARRVLAPDAIGFSSFDAGTTSMEVLNDPDKPCYGQFGGQYSFMVNFVLLEAVAKHVGVKTIVAEPQKEFVGRSLGTNVASLMDLMAVHPEAAFLKPWEQDRLAIQTIQALNKTYESPYKRKIEFALQRDMPLQERQAVQATLATLKENGVPDTVAYLTEEEVLRAGADLGELGYDRQAIPAALAVPPQPVDYMHLLMTPS